MNIFGRWIRGIALVLTIGCFVEAPVRAGSSAASKVGVEKFGEVAIRNFAVKVNDKLDSHHVNVAIIARCGRVRTDLPNGIRYTHVGIAVFEPVRTKDGSVAYTYAVYNLYQGSAGHDDRSYLAQDLTYDFVAGISETDVAVCVPTEVLQQRILKVIRSPLYQSLHTPAYNLVANPWVDRYDNCVTHTLKVCVAAIYQTDDRQRIYDDIRRYFKPTPVRLEGLQAFGSHFMSSISREDMDPSGLQTATYDSLETFLRSNELEKESFTVALD